MKNEKHSQQQAPEDGAGPVLPAGWHFALTLTPDADGELGGVAELHEHDTLRCRMVLTRYGQDRAAAVERVHARVEYWLSEWLARPHTGATEFGDLED